MRTADEIAQAVIYAEKVKSQRRDAAARQRVKYQQNGYKRLQVYVPEMLLAGLYEHINSTVKTYERGFKQ